MKILFLCSRDEMTRDRGAFGRAFEKLGLQTDCLPRDFDDDIGRLVEDPDSLILYVDGPRPRLPRGLVDTQATTACFQIDVHHVTRRRVTWSTLFDHVFLFHPGYENAFTGAGHSSVTLLGHAVESDFFSEGRDPDRDLDLDVAWVGLLQGPLYGLRRRVIAELARRFKMNDPSASYSIGETAEIYRRAKVVVNVGGDPWPHDANLRCFEAMASGALLVTSLPSELEQMGFRAGEHFVGYREEGDVIPTVLHYLGEADERVKIAERGRLNVLEDHTYDARAEAILRTVGNPPAGAGKAPGRRFSQREVESIYLDYFVSHHMWARARDSAFRLLRQSPLHAARTTLKMAVRSTRRHA